MNKSLVPFFSANKRTIVENYQHRRNCIEYMQGLYENCIDKKAIMVASGYSIKSYNKFMGHKNEFNYFKRNIPRKYFEAIGGEIEVLLELNKMDIQLHKEALDNLDLFPKYASLRLMACVWQQINFEEGITEAEAIEIIRPKTTNTIAFIMYGDVKLVQIKNREVLQVYNYPGLRIEKNLIIPTKNAMKGIGEVYFG
jgi:hypothetical protein